MIDQTLVEVYNKPSKNDGKNLQKKSLTDVSVAVVFKNLLLDFYYFLQGIFVE